MELVNREWGGGKLMEEGTLVSKPDVTRHDFAAGQEGTRPHSSPLAGMSRQLEALLHVLHSRDGCAPQALHSHGMTVAP
jgi:hypothetical protein